MPSSVSSSGVQSSQPIAFAKANSAPAWFMKASTFAMSARSFRVGDGPHRRHHVRGLTVGPAAVFWCGCLYDLPGGFRIEPGRGDRHGAMNTQPRAVYDPIAKK
jgi:hypothetical protein